MSDFVNIRIQNDELVRRFPCGRCRRRIPCDIRRRPCDFRRRRFDPVLNTLGRLPLDPLLNEFVLSTTFGDRDANLLINELLI